MQRGSHVPLSPVLYSYLIVEMNTATLFIDSNKVPEEGFEHLKKARVKLKPYGEILSDIERKFFTKEILYITSCMALGVEFSVFLY